MIKNIAFIFVLYFSFSTVQAQTADAVLGKWLNPSGEGQVMIYKQGERYHGKLVWIKEPNDEKGHPKLDIKNPTEKLRSRPILGLGILKDFMYEDGKWTNGSIYDPKTGKTYSCNLTLKENGQLNIRGYIGISIIGRSEVWRKVK